MPLGAQRNCVCRGAVASIPNSSEELSPSGSSVSSGHESSPSVATLIASRKDARGKAGARRVDVRTNPARKQDRINLPDAQRLKLDQGRPMTKHSCAHRHYLPGLACIRQGGGES
jgi:hypothetical protein